MVGCKACSGCYKVAAQQQVVAHRTISLAPTIFARVAAVLVDILQNKVFDAVSKEVYRSLHLLMFVKTEYADHPLVARVCSGADDYILRDVVLLLCLLKGKVALWQKVLIHHHTVVEILVGGDARKGNLLPVVTRRNTLGNSDAVVRRRVVVANRADKLAILLLAALYSTCIGVWITILVKNGNGKGVVYRQEVFAPLELCADIATTLTVEQRVVIAVTEISVVV